MKRNALPKLVLGMAGLLLTAPACANVGRLINDRPDHLYGQVRSVDVRRGYLGIEQDRGRDYAVRFDGRTRVVYGGRVYPVGSLRRGDLVRVRLQYEWHGDPWADLIELRREPRGGRDVVTGPRVERWNGVVARVDSGRGWFVLDRGRGAEVRILIARDGRRDDRDRMGRLRQGQRVAVEVRTSDRGEAELVRFR